MLDNAHLEALLALEREGSFEGAARSLRVSSSAISQRIKLLEERIGAMVVSRQPPIKPTEIGASLCRHAEMVMIFEDSIFQSKRDGVCLDSGYVRQIKIIVNDSSLSSWFMDVLSEESELPSSYMYELMVSDRDHSLHDLKGGSALAAVSEKKEAAHGFRSSYLGAHIFKATASPDFMERYFSNGVTLESLKAAPTLRYGPRDDLQSQWIVQEFGEWITLNGHTLPSSYGSVDACLRNVAWGMNSTLMVDHYIAEGSLVELIPGSDFRNQLYWHCSRLIEEPLQKFSQRVADVAAKRLDQSSRVHMKASSLIEGINHLVT